MIVKIFFVLLLCALQQVDGSKSRKKGEGGLKILFKNCLIALAMNYGANELFSTGKPQVVDSNCLDCKYNVPDQNAEVIMNFVMCAKDQDFARYMFDNSENCPKMNELYKLAESDGNCAMNTPKIIHNGALARFRGEQLSQATNLEMLKEYLLSYSSSTDDEEYSSKEYLSSDELFESEESASDFLRILDLPGNFDFFRFTNIFELTKHAYPDDAKEAVRMALMDEFKDVNADNAKKLFELTKFAYPDQKWMPVLMALDSKYKDINTDNAKKVIGLLQFAQRHTYSFPGKQVYKVRAVGMALDEFKDVNADNAKKLFELIKLAFPDDLRKAFLMAMKVYKDVNADNANKLFELTKFICPNDTLTAVQMALDNHDVSADNVKKLLELTNLAFPDDARTAVSMALRWPGHTKMAIRMALDDYKDVNVDNAKKLFELTKLAYPDDAKKAVRMALKDYKDVNADQVKRVLELTKILNPKYSMAEALKPKYKDVDVDKVNTKYQDLKNSRSWFNKSKQTIMKEVLRISYPEVVKEDF